MVTGGGRGVVGHVGARLLADLADATGLTSVFSEALAGLRQRRGGHDPGRIAVDLAVMLADGGEAIADLAVLRDQPGLFGPVASDPTAWRLLSQLDESLLAGLRAARARAREVAWAQRAEVRGDLPQPVVAGRQVEGLVLDIDATIVICHSEKESATRTWKKTFGYHPGPGLRGAPGRRRVPPPGPSVPLSGSTSDWLRRCRCRSAPLCRWPSRYRRPPGRAPTPHR
jgi:hypothetical protein